MGSIFGLLSWVLLAIAAFFGLSAVYSVVVLKEPARDAMGPAFAKLREGALFAKDMIGIVALTVFDKLRGLVGGMGGSRGRDGFRGLDDDGSGPGRALLSDEDDDFS